MFEKLRMKAILAAPVLATSAQAAINWTDVTAKVTSSIALIGTIVSEVVGIIPDILVLIIMLAIAAFAGGFLKEILRKIRSP